eukprot:gene850-1655_t
MENFDPFESNDSFYQQSSEPNDKDVNEGERFEDKSLDVDYAMESGLDSVLNAYNDDDLLPIDKDIIEGEGFEDNATDVDYTLESGLDSVPLGYNEEDPFVAQSTSFKIKKPSSAWIHYSTMKREILRKENPQLSFKEIAQALSESYKLLNDEEKAKFEAMAAEDKARYTREMIAQGPSRPIMMAKSTNSTELHIPLARIKKTMKMDPEVNQIQKNALLAVAKATELFLQFIGTRSNQVANQRRTGGKSIRTADLITSIHSVDILRFLREDFPKTMAPASAPTGGKSGSKTNKMISMSTTTVTQKEKGKSSIMNFFGHKRKADFDNNNDENNNTIHNPSDKTTDNDNENEEEEEEGKDDEEDETEVIAEETETYGDDEDDETQLDSVIDHAIGVDVDVDTGVVNMVEEDVHT